MSVDWITVCAQIVNFMILVWLLRRFLYQPVIDAMERRGQHISAQLDDAQMRQTKADAMQRQYQDASDALQRSVDATLEEAKLQAELAQRQLLSDAREKVAQTRNEWRQQIAHERQEFISALKVRASGAVFDVARKSLADLADTQLEEQMVRVFCTRLKTLDSQSRDALSQSTEPIVIETAFTLDKENQEHIVQSVSDHLNLTNPVKFTSSPTLLCGIELSTAGQRLSWNLANYLDELIERVDGSLLPPTFQ